MPPRALHRRRSNLPSAGKNPGKKTTKAHSPSVTLQEILTSLDITYSKDLGILNGAATRVAPEVSTVENLRRLLLKLNDQLEIVSNNDDTLLADIQDMLLPREKGFTADKEHGEHGDEGEEPEDEEAEEEEAERDEEEDGQEDEQEEDEQDEQEEEEEDEEDEDEEEILNDDEDYKGPVTKTDDASLSTNALSGAKKQTESIGSARDGDGDISMDVQDGTNPDEEDPEGEKDVFTDASDKIIKSPEGKERKLSMERMENDPSVRNPKSEFVTAQTLPAAAHALGLFSEEDGGLNQTGEEFLKKKYAVSSYPKTDLRDKLPGVIPDIDFSKSKPTNQVQFATFQSWFENFYRAFSEDDLKFLKDNYIMPDALANDQSYDPKLTPYLIPDLGMLYSDVWNEEENAGNYSPPPQRVTKEAVMAKNSSTDLNDDTIETESVSCGPLVSRLLSALMKDDFDVNGVVNGDDDEDIKGTPGATALGDQGWKVSSVNTDYSTLEDRLKRELKHIGIFMNLSTGDKENEEDAEPDWLNPQDDEVSTELRALQFELKQVSKRNNKRKKIMLPIVENQLAWQEYNSILDDLEKQVDQAYLKRIRAPKNKKRKTGGSSIPPSVQVQMNAQAAQQAAANSAVKSLLEKRQRWIEKVGPLFDVNGDGPESMKKYPKESVFDKENLDEDEDEDYDDGDELVLQQQDHQ